MKTDPELALLACALTNADAFELASETVRPEHFGSPMHRAAWEAIIALTSAGHTVNSITVATRAPLPNLPKVSASTKEVTSYAAAVIDAWYRRRGLAYTRQAIEDLDDIQIDARTTVMGLGGRLGDLGTIGSDDTLKLAGDSLDAALATYRNVLPGAVSGLPTGLDELDRCLGGLREGEVTIIAGRPGSGKSSFVFDMLLNRAIDGFPCIGFSLEMPAVQVVIRNACSLSGLNFRKLRDGNADLAEWACLNQARDTIKRLPLWIDDKPGITITEIKSKCRRINNQLAKTGQRLRVVGIDYLQLMGMNRKHGDESALSDTTRELKTMAKELGVVLVLLCQLNRSLESRDDKRPRLADLRGSGAIEQDADNVVMIYRDAMYRADAPHPWVAELNVEKQRQGPTISTYAYFQASLTRFRSLTAEERLKAQLPLMR